MPPRRAAGLQPLVFYLLHRVARQSFRDGAWVAILFARWRQVARRIRLVRYRAALLAALCGRVLLAWRLAVRGSAAVRAARVRVQLDAL